MLYFISTEDKLYKLINGSDNRNIQHIDKQFSLILATQYQLNITIITLPTLLTTITVKGRPIHIFFQKAWQQLKLLCPKQQLFFFNLLQIDHLALVVPHLL